MCTTNLKRMSLGTDRDAPACIQANDVKKEPPAKRNVKRPKHTVREPGPDQIYRWVLPCYNVDIVNEPCPRHKKLKLFSIWATCKLCKYKNAYFRAFGVKTKFLIGYRSLDV